MRCGTLACALVFVATAAHAFDLQGHRGARGLMPENTLEGFSAALAIGVTIVWSPLFLDLTPGATAEAKAIGLKVLPWTVNERADMDRLIRDGVDGIITDYPDRLPRRWRKPADRCRRKCQPGHSASPGAEYDTIARSIDRQASPSLA